MKWTGPSRVDLGRTEITRMRMEYAGGLHHSVLISSDRHQGPMQYLRSVPGDFISPSYAAFCWEVVQTGNLILC
jgi:hypothetical protein